MANKETFYAAEKIINGETSWHAGLIEKDGVYANLHALQNGD